MTMHEPLATECRHYLDLCPTEHTTTGDGGFCVTLDHRRGAALTAAYGRFTVMIELLNQLAVRSVRTTQPEAARVGTRILPASLRNVRVANFIASHRVVAHIGPVGPLWRVQMDGLTVTGAYSGFSALAYLAAVTEPC